VTLLFLHGFFPARLECFDGFYCTLNELLLFFPAYLFTRQPQKTGSPQFPTKQILYFQILKKQSLIFSILTTYGTGFEI